MSFIVEMLHGTAMQGEPPELLSPALAPLADTANSATSIEEEVAEFSQEEEIVEHDLGRDKDFGKDHLDNTFSPEPAADDEAGIDLELAPVFETMEREKEVELDLEVADEFDIQTEPAKSFDHQSADLEETLESEEKISDQATAASSLIFESSDRSDLPSETGAGGQEVTLDFPDDSLDLWSFNAEDDDTILDKVSDDIFGVLELVGGSVSQSPSTEPVSDSASAKQKGTMKRKEIEEGEETEGVLEKVSKDIMDVLNKEKKYSVG